MSLKKYVDCIVKVTINTNPTGNEIEKKELVGKLLSADLGSTGWDSSLFIKKEGYEVQGYKFTGDQVLSLEIYDDSSKEVEDLRQVVIENKAEEDDLVNHPAHYTDGKIEVIDFIEDKKLNFCRGNAVKYIARAGKKDPTKEIEDLEKAIWYLNREIGRLKNEKNN